MSLQLLKSLNGNKKGQFKNFIDNLNDKPRIAWYPSAGQDFRALLYLNPRFSEIHPASMTEPDYPDIFIFTDYFPYQNSTFLDTRTIFQDDSTKIFVEQIEELPRLNLPLHREVVDFVEGSIATDRLIFLMVKVESNTLGTRLTPVLYAFAENETFFCKKLIPNNAIITHIIHVRYGGGLGGGGKATGIWLLNVLKQLKCELLITDNDYRWQSGDKFTLTYSPSIPPEGDAILITIRTLESKFWSNHGDVEWQVIK